MSSISQYLSSEHGHCDNLFVEMENAVVRARWNDAEVLFYSLRTWTELHFSREEQGLFPAFEQVTTYSGGPTEVMRSEHRQMRHILQDMDDSLKKRDVDQFLGEAETLLPMMKQHNSKEETMLYRMADQILANQADSLIEKMQALGVLA